MSVAEPLKALLASATREMRWGSEQDPVAQQILRDPLCDEILSLVPGDCTWLMGGRTAFALAHGETEVVRIGSIDSRVDSPHVLQASRVIHVGSRWMIEVLPRLDTNAVSQSDIDAISGALANSGFEFVDPGLDNIGRATDGRVLVLDPGAVARNRNFPAAIPTENNMTDWRARTLEKAITHLGAIEVAPNGYAFRFAESLWPAIEGDDSAARWRLTDGDALHAIACTHEGGLRSLGAKRQLFDESVALHSYWSPTGQFQIQIAPRSWVVARDKAAVDRELDAMAHDGIEALSILSVDYFNGDTVVTRNPGMATESMLRISPGEIVYGLFSSIIEAHPTARIAFEESTPMAGLTGDFTRFRIYRSLSRGDHEDRYALRCSRPTATRVHAEVVAHNAKLRGIGEVLTRPTASRSFAY